MWLTTNKKFKFNSNGLILFISVILISWPRYSQANPEEQLERDLRQKQLDFKNLLGDFASCAEELDQIKAAHGQERGNCVALQQQVDELEGCVESLRSALQDKESLVNQLENSVSQEREKRQLEFDRIMSLRADAGKLVSNSEAQTQQLLQENAQLNAQLEHERSAIAQKLQNLQQQLDENVLNMQNKALLERQMKLKEAFENASENLEVLQKQSAAKYQELLAKKDGELLAATKKTSQVEQHSSLQGQKLHGIQKSLKAIRDENTALTQRLCALNADNLNLRTKHNNVTLTFLQDRTHLERAMGSKLAQTRGLLLEKYQQKHKRANELLLQNEQLKTRLAALEKDKQEMLAAHAGVNTKLNQHRVTSKKAAQSLLEQFKTEQQNYAQRLKEFKSLAQSTLGDRERQLKEYTTKFEKIMADLVVQRKEYSNIFQELQIAKANLDLLKKADHFQTSVPVDKRQQLVAKKLARDIEKLEKKLSVSGQREQQLQDALKVAKSECEILKHTADEIFDVNSRLTQDNENLKQKFVANEQTLLELKKQARELAKREAELIEKIVSLESCSSENAEKQAFSSKLAQRLQAARDDYARLKEEVQTLAEKLTASNKLATTLHEEALSYQRSVVETQTALDDKEKQIGALKDKMRGLLSNIGLQMNNLESTSKYDYLFLVTNHELEKLTASVLSQGKSSLEQNLRQILDDADLISSLVERLVRKIETPMRSASQNNFSKIFQSIQRNNLLAEMSNLYGLFVAQAGAGKQETDAFKKYKCCLAKHFGDPSLEDVPMLNLCNPNNALLQCVTRS